VRRRRGREAGAGSWGVCREGPSSSVRREVGGSPAYPALREALPCPGALLRAGQPRCDPRPWLSPAARTQAAQLLSLAGPCAPACSLLGFSLPGWPARDGLGELSPNTELPEGRRGVSRGHRLWGAGGFDLGQQLHDCSERANFWAPFGSLFAPPGFPAVGLPTLRKSDKASSPTAHTR